MKRLERFVRAHALDAGCDETTRLMHVHAEALLTGETPETRYPGIAALDE
jgi:hypothetical protein